MDSIFTFLFLQLGMHSQCCVMILVQPCVWTALVVLSTEGGGLIQKTVISLHLILFHHSGPNGSVLSSKCAFKTVLRCFNCDMPVFFQPDHHLAPRGAIKRGTEAAYSANRLSTRLKASRLIRLITHYTPEPNGLYTRLQRTHNTVCTKVCCYGRGFC